MLCDVIFLCQKFNVYFSVMSWIVETVTVNCTCPVNNCLLCIACDVLSLHFQIHIKHGSNFKWKSRCKVERDGQKWTDSEVSNSILNVSVYHVIDYKNFVIKLSGSILTTITNNFKVV